MILGNARSPRPAARKPPQNRRPPTRRAAPCGAQATRARRNRGPRATQKP
jgi:hypothetical protein